MTDLKKVYDTSIADYQSALLEQQANYQRASLSGDMVEQVRAAQEMAALRAQMREFQAMAQEHVQSTQAQPQGNKYGLTEREVEAAHNSFGPIKEHGQWRDLSNEEKEQLYAQNRQKLRQMRASGEYTDQTR